MAELQHLPRSVHWGMVRHHCVPSMGRKRRVLQFLVDFLSALLLLTEGGLEMGTEGKGESALNKWLIILFRRRCVP